MIFLYVIKYNLYFKNIDMNQFNVESHSNFIINLEFELELIRVSFSSPLYRCIYSDIALKQLFLYTSVTSGAIKYFFL